MEIIFKFNFMKNRFKRLNKISTVTVLLSLLLLLFYKCTSPRPSSFSTRPDHFPYGIKMKSVMADGLDGDFFYADSSKPQKALVLLGGSEGGKYWSYQPEFIHELIEQGFCVLSLAYFRTSNLPNNLRGIPLEYFSKAFHWLSTQEDLVTPDDYALVGLSRGAELALLVGSRYSEVKAVVAIDPSSVVFPGPPTGIVDALGKQHSAWCEKGQELPFVPMPYSWTTLKGMISGKRTLMFKKALRNTQRAKEAAIPAEKIQGPILLVSFTKDQIWPSTLMSDQIMERLRDKNFHFHFDHATYDGSHSEWSIEPCQTNILTFLREQFLKPTQK